ncbi:MAG TPA: sulfatase-like hydrolase/transferase [Syntrophorhabdaceae bacterium]|jgi:hypothetical protein
MDVIFSLRNNLSKIFLSRGLAPAVFFAIFLYTILYRVGLFYALYQKSQNLGLVVLGIGTGGIIMYFGTLFKDAIVAAALGFVVWGVQRVLAPLSRRQPLTAKWIVLSVGWLVLLLLSTTFALHWEILSQMGAAPTVSLVYYALQNSTVFEFLSYGSMVDALLVLLIMPAFLLQVLLPDTPRAFLRKWLIFIFVASLLAFIFSYLRPWEEPGDGTRNKFVPTQTKKVLAGRFDPAVTANPFAHLLMSLVWTPHNSFRALEKLPSPEQQRTPAYLDPLFTTTRPAPGGHVPAFARKPWNIVLVQMEGVNQEYAFAVDPLKGPVMPFLTSLAGKSLVLGRHFSTAVDTEVAVFSLFTGLFPMTQPIKLVLRPDLKLPTVFSLLSPTHSSFLVAASNLRMWYPVGLLKNSGLQEIWDVENSPSGKYYVGFMNFKDEKETADLFIEKVKNSKKPFIGVYCPYATHFPYVSSEMTKEEAQLKKRERYMITLRLVDAQIKRVFDALESQNLLDSTIFVVTADHGEAFGEHGTWAHGTSLFNTAVNVPMLFYQPKLFPGERRLQITSHADLLPTLLDVMGVGYSEGQFEGESILRERRRKYTFFYTPRSDQLGSVSNEGIKLWIDYRTNRCTAFDLRSDFAESNPSDCASHREQLEALSTFRRYHTNMLLDYSGVRPVPSTR